MASEMKKFLDSRFQDGVFAHCPMPCMKSILKKDMGTLDFCYICQKDFNESNNFWLAKAAELTAKELKDAEEKFEREKKKVEEEGDTSDSWPKTYGNKYFKAVHGVFTMYFKDASHHEDWNQKILGVSSLDCMNTFNDFYDSLPDNYKRKVALDHFRDTDVKKYDDLGERIQALIKFFVDHDINGAASK